MSFVQQLNQADPEKHLNFATNFLSRIIVDKEWQWNILWFDEAHFTLDGALNNQNCRIRPYVEHEPSLHSDYIRVWCGFTADFIHSWSLFFRVEYFSRPPEVFPRECMLLQFLSTVHHSRFTSTRVLRD